MCNAGCAALAYLMVALAVGNGLPSGRAANFPAAVSARAEGSIAAGAASSEVAESLGLKKG
jgi:hypothetical protein